MSRNNPSFPLWIRYFAKQKDTQAPAALAMYDVEADTRMCRGRDELLQEIAQAKSRRVIVLDGHGVKCLAGIGVQRGGPTPYVEVAEFVEKLGPLDSCQVLILGGCFQGNHFEAWRAFAPRAIMVAAVEEIFDVPGSRQIARALGAVAKLGDNVTAENISTAMGNRYGYVAKPPLV